MTNILSNLLENLRQRALVLSTFVLSTGTKYNCTVVQRTSTFVLSTLYLSTSTKYNFWVQSTCTFTSKNVLVLEISTYWVRKVLSIVLSIQCLKVTHWENVSSGYDRAEHDLISCIYLNFHDFYEYQIFMRVARET